MADSISVSVKLDSRFKIVGAEINRAADQAVRWSLLNLEGMVKMRIVTYPAHGRAQKVGLVDTRTMLNSVAHAPLGPAKGHVWVGAEYAHYLEFGTRFVGPWPFFVPAFEDFKPYWRRVIREIPRVAIAMAGKR